MSNKLWILTLLLVIGSGQLMAQSMPQPMVKLATINRVHAITGQLLEIAKNRVAHGGDLDRSLLNDEIDRLLQSERNPDVLALVAQISNIYLQPGSAGDERFDDVFDVAWDICIMRIGQIGGQPAIDVLKYIE